MDPSYAAMLAFNAVSSHFYRRSQARTSDQERDQQHAFQQQQFEAQRAAQAKSNRKNSMLNCPRPWVRLRNVVA